MNPCETLNKLNDWRKSKEYCDVVLIVEGWEFHCHRAILATTVQYFDKMFGGSFREYQSPSVELKNLSKSYFDDFLEYIYTGKIKITELSSAEHLLTFSSYFSVDCLMGKCIEYIESNMDIREAMNFHLLAEKTGCTSLKEFTTDFIESNFSAIAATEGFLEMPFSIVNELISSDTIIVEDEKFIFQTINQWVQYDPANRKEYFPQLFENIRFKFVPYDYVANDVLANDFVIEYARSCVQVISSKDGCEPRISASPNLIYLFGGRKTEDDSDKIGVVCWNGSEFNDVRRMDWSGSGVKRYEAVCHNNLLHMYVVLHSGRYFGYFGNGKWISLQTPSSNQNVWIDNLVSLDNCNRIYANSYNDVYYYNADDDAWNALIAEGYTDDLGENILGAVLVGWENNLFSIGGEQLSSLHKLKIYDSRVDKWESRADLPHGVDCESNAAAFGNEIYVTEAGRKIQIYDIRKDNWRSGSRMTKAGWSRFHYLVAGPKKLYAIGRLAIDIYDPVVDAWSIGPSIDAFNDRYDVVGVSCNRVY